MNINEALAKCKPHEYLTRQEWLDKGSVMRLSTSAKTIEMLDVILSNESRNADDWVIVE